MCQGACLTRRLHRDKSIQAGIVSSDPALAQVIQPAVQPQIALLQTSRHGGMCAQITQLLDYIALRHGQKKLRTARASFELGDRFARGLGVIQPGGHAGQRFQRLGIQHALHHAAVGVPAHDHIRHAQHAHRVFDGGRNAADGVRIRRNNVADDPADEQLARLGLRQHAGIDAGIGAGDEQGFRPLPQGELLEQVAVLGVDALLESRQALENPLHGQLFYTRGYSGTSR